jgi:RNA polymerase sigma-70 factor (ECF subfamily)
VLQDLRAGDARRFALIVRRHQARVYRLAFSLVRNESDANDIVQEAFLRVYRKRDAFEGDSAFYTWLYRIVRNLAIDLLRRPYRGRVELEELEAIGAASALSVADALDVRSPDEDLWRRELAAHVRQALALLPNIHREVIVLRELLGMSYGEIAARLGCAQGTVMSRLFHARRRLKASLQTVYSDALAIPNS